MLSRCNICSLLIAPDAGVPQEFGKLNTVFTHSGKYSRYEPTLFPFRSATESSSSISPRYRTACRCMTREGSFRPDDGAVFGAFHRTKRS
jgi:hypothetical protein